jgi:hypothetical protein
VNKAPRRRVVVGRLQTSMFTVDIANVDPFLEFNPEYNIHAGHFIALSVNWREVARSVLFYVEKSYGAWKSLVEHKDEGLLVLACYEGWGGRRTRVLCIAVHELYGCIIGAFRWESELD